MIVIPALGQYGFIPDQPAQELPVNAFTSCLNVRFRGGSLERVGGHRQIFDDTTVEPLFVIPYQAAGKRFWVHCGTDAVFADDGTTRTDITGTPPTGTADDRWTGAVLNGVLLLNNGVDAPQYWGGDTAGNLADLTGWDAAWTCKSIGAFKNFAVAVGIAKSGTDYPHMVKWSNAADPGAIPPDWDETGAGGSLAGEQDLAETTDLIVDQLVLGDANLIYKERSIYAMRFIGGTQVFEFRRVPGNFGMLAKGCACVTPKGHLVLGNGDLVLVDGINEPQSIVVDRLRDWLFRSQIDSTQYEKCFVVANPSMGEAWVCYPSVGSTYCDRALIWNWESNTFGLRELPNINHAASGLLEYSAGETWDADSDSWDSDDSAWNQDEFGPTEPRLMLASNDDKIYIADSGNSFDGTAFDAYAERDGLAFDAPDDFKLLRSITPRVRAANGTTLSIRMGGSADAEAAPTYSPAVTYTVGTTRKADAFASGRFMAYRISSSGGSKWRIKSMSLDAQPMGQF